MGAYAYEVGSAIKLNRNYGRLYFPDDLKAGNAIDTLNTAMVQDVTKCQLSKKLISYDKKAFSTGNVEDMTSISFTLYNSANPSIQQRFYFPGIEIIRHASGPLVGKRDDQAMQAVIAAVAADFIAQGVQTETGVLLDTLLIPGLPKRMLDVTREDTIDTSRTA